MIRTKTVSTDTLLSNNKLATLVVRGCIEELAQLTDLTHEQSLALIKQELLRKKYSASNKEVINHNESEFIFSLFR